MYYIIFFRETCVGTYLSVFRFILLFTINTSFSNTHTHTNNQTNKQINTQTIYTKEFTRVHQILIRFAFLIETLKSRFAFLHLVL